MPEQNGDKSQDPTPHRRQQAREQGQVARSQDLGSAALLICALLGLLWTAGSLIGFLSTYTASQLGGQAWLTIDAATAVHLWSTTLSDMAAPLLVLMAVVFVAGVAVNVLQVGFLFLPDKVAPKASNIDPIKGLRRLFSTTAVARLAFGIFKVLVVAGVTYWSLYADRHEVLALAHGTVADIGTFLLDILFWTTMKVAVALLILALLDYAFQRWKQEQDLRMTTQEVREEMKNLQGDPQIMARRRAAQRQLALNRLGSAVPKADVVITNPTELAVAIQYDEQTMLAPIVVAKGAGVIAARIRKLAIEHGIPVIEKKPLAQALFKEVEVNHPIPDKMYAAVAEILTYVYQLKGKSLSKPA